MFLHKAAPPTLLLGTYKLFLDGDLLLSQCSTTKLIITSLSTHKGNPVSEKAPI